MGLPTFFRQRIRAEAASIQAKTFFGYLVSYVRQRRQVSVEEAVLIAGDSLQYLNRYLGMRWLGEVEFPAVAVEPVRGVPGHGLHCSGRMCRGFVE
ncbi:MAG TPA: hypothetical protein GXX40_06210 [Firmicutes bacterium]|nr:hypothetical protein [Bacillota bacterium]